MARRNGSSVEVRKPAVLAAEAAAGGAAVRSQARCGHSDDARAVGGVLPADVSFAAHGRSRDCAQAAAEDFFPDILRRARSAAGRRRPGDAAGLRLVLSLLPRPRHLPGAGQHGRGTTAAGGGRGGRSRQRRAADAVALVQHEAAYRHAEFGDGDAVPACGRLRGGGAIFFAPSRGRGKKPVARLGRLSRVQGGRVPRR